MADDTAASIIQTASRNCILGLAVLTGLCCSPHRDSRDIMDGWIVDIVFGDFERLTPRFLKLVCILTFRPGDVVFMRSALLQHSVSDTNDHTPWQRLPDECFPYTIGKTANAYRQSCRQIQHQGRFKSPLRMYQRSAIIPSEKILAAVFSIISKASIQSIFKRNLDRPLQNRWCNRCNRTVASGLCIAFLEICSQQSLSG